MLKAYNDFQEHGTIIVFFFLKILQLFDNKTTVVIEKKSYNYGLLMLQWVELHGPLRPWSTNATAVEQVWGEGVHQRVLGFMQEAPCWPPTCAASRSCATDSQGFFFLPQIDTNLSSWILCYDAVGFLHIAAGSSETTSSSSSPLLLATPRPSNPPYSLPPTSHSTYTGWHVFVYLFRVSSAHKRLSVPPQEGIICKMKMCLNMSRCELRVAKVLLCVWPGKPTHGDPLSSAPFKKKKKTSL